MILAAGFISACGKSGAATPIETLTAYTIAVSKQDTAMMKRLLSKASLKIHEEEAKAQNVSVDEIIKRDTLFPAEQRVFDYRNEKVEGDIATVEVENDFGGWDVISLVKEDGMWKIDKKGTSDQILNQVEEDQKKLNESMNQIREQTNQDMNQTNDNLNTNQDFNQNLPLDDSGNQNNQILLPNDPNAELNDPNAQPLK